MFDRHCLRMFKALFFELLLVTFSISLTLDKFERKCVFPRIFAESKIIDNYQHYIQVHFTFSFFTKFHRFLY